MISRRSRRSQAATKLKTSLLEVRGLCIRIEIPETP